MKFLAVVFAIVLVVQLADVAAEKLSFNDLIETHGEQENLENNQVKVATEDMKSLVRKKECKTNCLSLCKNRIADILSFMDLMEEYEEQQNIKSNNLRITSEDMMSLSTRRKCFSACLSRCKS